MQVGFDKNGMGIRTGSPSQVSVETTKQKEFPSVKGSNAKAEISKGERKIREDFLALAAKIQNGEIDQAEATEAFVELVATKRTDPKELQKDVALAQNAVAEFLKADSNFSMELQEHLKKLANRK